MYNKQPITIPPEAFAALASLQNSLEVGGEYLFGVGAKRTGEKVLDDLALIVYIPKKIPLAMVPESRRVPTQFQGFLTDVVEHHNILLADTTKYDPLRGGIQMGPSLQTSESGVLGFPENGTLGVAVRRRADGRRLWLTCEHVASHRDLADPHRNTHDCLFQHMFQPALDPNHPENGASVFGLCVDASIDLDAAIIDPTNASPPRFESNTIQEVGPVRGSNTVMLFEQVWKRGATTGLTNGVVVAYLPVPGGGAPQDIEVDGFPFFQKRFADHGDSGSAVVNNKQEVVALLKSMFDETGTRCFATLIDPIREALKIDIAVGPLISSITPNFSILPTSGPVTIEGLGFDPPSRVDFGIGTAQVLEETPTRLVVIPPPMLAATVVDVRVENKWLEFSEASPSTKFEYRSIV